MQIGRFHCHDAAGSSQPMALITAPSPAQIRRKRCTDRAGNGDGQQIQTHSLFDVAAVPQCEMHGATLVQLCCERTGRRWGVSWEVPVVRSPLVRVGNSNLTHSPPKHPATHGVVVYGEGALVGMHVT